MGGKCCAFRKATLDRRSDVSRKPGNYSLFLRHKYQALEIERAELLDVVGKLTAGNPSSWAIIHAVKTLAIGGIGALAFSVLGHGAVRSYLSASIQSCLISVIEVGISAR